MKDIFIDLIATKAAGSTVYNSIQLWYQPWRVNVVEVFHNNLTDESGNMWNDLLRPLEDRGTSCLPVEGFLKILFFQVGVCDFS